MPIRLTVRGAATTQDATHRPAPPGFQVGTKQTRTVRLSLASAGSDKDRTTRPALRPLPSSWSSSPSLYPSRPPLRPVRLHPRANGFARRRAHPPPLGPTCAHSPAAKHRTTWSASRSSVRRPEKYFDRSDLPVDPHLFSSKFQQRLSQGSADIDGHGLLLGRRAGFDSAAMIYAKDKTRAAHSVRPRVSAVPQSRPCSCSERRSRFSSVRITRSCRMTPQHPRLGAGVSARSRAPLTLPCSPPGQPGA